MIAQFGCTDVQACMCVITSMFDSSFAAAQNLNYFVVKINNFLSR